MIYKNFVHAGFLFFLMTAVSQAWSKEPVASSKENMEQLKKQLKKKNNSLLSSRSNRKFSRVHSYLRKNNKTARLKAIERLQKILNESSSLPFEQASAHHFLGNIYASMEDFKKSITHFKQAVSLKSLSYNKHLGTLLLLAQLYLMTENTALAKQYLHQWQALSETRSPIFHVLMSQAFYMEKKPKRALTQIHRAIDLSKKPKKRWLAFAAGLSIEQEDYTSAEALYRRLVYLYPKAQKSWKQLAETQHKNKKPKETLASMQLAHKVQPLQEEPTILSLVSLLGDQGIPYKAGKSLEQAINKKKVKSSQENYEKLGDFWWWAEEINRALKAYHTSANLSSTPQIFFKLGRIYYAQNNWSQAVSQMEKGLSLDRSQVSKDEIDEIHMKIGFAYYNLRQCNKAIQAFEQAEISEGFYEIKARRFIRQVKQEAETGFCTISV